MDPAAIGVMIPIVLSLGAFVMIIYIRKYTNLERMAIIEKGLDPAIFTKKNEQPTSLALHAALLLIGAGVGLLLGYFLDRTYDMEEVAYFSMLFICGGIGLGIAYMIEEKKMKNK